jgi:hypothetical protein
MSSAPHTEGQAKDPVSLVLVGLLVAVVGLGLLFAAPGLGIVLLILFVPILVRIARGPVETGQPATGTQKVMGVLGSLGMLIAIGLASFAAFYATCFVVCLGGLAIEDLRKDGAGDFNWIFVASVSAGLAVGVFVMVKLIRRFRQRRG